MNRPGEFPLVHQMDVVQALSVAGGLSTFAAADHIKIIRRVGLEQSILTFRYGDIEEGKSLSDNIILQAGDVILVP